MPDFFNNLLQWRRANFQHLVAQEQQLINLFTRNRNFTPQTVLAEIREINRLFGSQQNHIEQIAQRIYELHPNYNNGNIRLLNNVARAISNSNEDISTAQFTLATRMCAYHNLVTYPLYDILIEKLIIRLREQQRNLLPNASQIRRDAELLAIVYDTFKQILGIQNISYKDIYDFIQTLAFIKFCQKINQRTYANVARQPNIHNPILRYLLSIPNNNQVDIQNINLTTINNFRGNDIFDVIAGIVGSAFDDEFLFQRRHHNQ